MKPGSVIIFNNKRPHILSWGQKVFTGQPWTHTAVGIPDVLGVESYIGADLLVDIQPTDRFRGDPKMEYLIFAPVGFTDKEIEDALRYTYARFAGRTYGFAQLLWFIERWFFWTIFKKDIRKWHNHFPNGTICSELAWHFMWYLGARYPALRTELDNWRPDTFHSGDACYVVSKFKYLWMLCGGNYTEKSYEALLLKPQGVR